MPHVVIEGPVSAEAIWLAFEPTQFAENNTQFKAEEAYLASDRKSVLVRSLTVERGFAKSFFVRIQEKENTVTLSLERLARPDVTDAVKRLIGLYAWKILQSEHDATVSGTNIEAFLGEPSREKA